MEELKLYKIYSYYCQGEYKQEYSTQIALATESEMKELVKKASWKNAPYGDPCMIYYYQETTMPRYDRNDCLYNIKQLEKENRCADCQHFINGKCKIYRCADHDQSNFIANDCKNFKMK